MVQPRKSPVQTRSKQTVAAILAATAQVLVMKGYEGATTGAIAERAGVGIGTLYQYFPNKEALVEALIRAHVAEVLTTVDLALAAAAALTAEESVQALVRAGLDAHRLDPALHKVLVEQVPRKGAIAKALDLSAEIQARIEAELLRRSPGLSPSKARMAAFMVETCVEALTHRAVVEAPEWLSSGLLEEEAAALLRPYIGRMASS